MAKLCKFLGIAWIIAGLLIIIYYSGSNGGSFADGNLIGEMPSWAAFANISDYVILPMFRIFAYVIPGFAVFYGAGYYLEKSEEGRVKEEK